MKGGFSLGPDSVLVFPLRVKGAQVTDEECRIDFVGNGIHDPNLSLTMSQDELRELYETVQAVLRKKEW